jgi:N-acyl-phosphatidylethanolamine-hydrolysing phospholipase D
MATIHPDIEVNLPQSTASGPPDHHVGNPPTSFKNPWPSSHRPHPTLLNLLATRFGFGGEQKNFVPIPATRDELVKIRKPDWGAEKKDKLRATWFGHASFLIETAIAPGAERGVRILLDPVFAEQMGPLAKLGPKRFSPLPCVLEDVPEVDLVLISHNHYDHLDVDAVKRLYAGRKRDMHFFCGLNTKAWFLACGIDEKDVTELDWWDEVEVKIKDVGSVKLVCTPAQHASSRTPTDRSHALWCSWAVEEMGLESPKKLYFAGNVRRSKCDNLD